MDTDLSKIQGGVMHILCPLAAAWNSLLEEGVAEDQDLLVPPSKVVAPIQRTICMVGNVSEMISQLRRTKILQNTETSWSKYGVEDFSGAEDTLFGEDLQTSLTDKVEKETTLAKAASITKRNKDYKGKDSPTSYRKDGHGHSSFFRGGPAYKYGNRQGKNFFPYGSESKRKGTIYQNNQTSGVRSRHAPYSTNLAYLPVRTNKHPNTGSNNANSQWSFQPWTGHKSHQSVYNIPSGWSFNTFCVKLEEDHTGSVDSSDSARSQTRIYQSSTQPTNSAACAGGRQSTSLIKGGGKTSTKGSHLSSSSWGHWLHEPNLCGTQVRWIMATCDKFKIPQPICEGPSLQDGIHKTSEGLDSGRRLLDKTRSKGCLSHPSSTSGSSEISEVPMARPTVAVQSPSLWFEQRPIHLHQAYEASGSIVEEVRNTNYPIFG